MKLTIEINYTNSVERVRHRQKAEELIRSGLESYSCKEFSFAINKEVKQEFPSIKLVRFEEINGEKCMIIPSKMNF
jgi:hypothetical protein